MTDIAALHAQAVDATGLIVCGVPADRCHAATPCAGWDARALVNHLVSGNQRGRVRRLWPGGRELALPGRGRDVDTVGWVPWAGPLTRALTANASVGHPEMTHLAPGPVPFGLRAGTAGGRG